MEHFTDYAVVSIYHFCDVGYRAKAKAAAKRLFAAGLVGSADVEEIGEECYQKYEALVVEHATENLPKGWELRRDYWGAKIMSDNHGWRDPKTGLYGGDSIGRIMWFDTLEAMEEYTQHQLETIPALKG